MSFESIAEPVAHLERAGSVVDLPAPDARHSRGTSGRSGHLRSKMSFDAILSNALDNLSNDPWPPSERDTPAQADVVADLTERRAAELSAGWGLAILVEAAHDMRSPLTSIMFLVDVLRQGRSGPLTETQERQLEIVYGAALSLSTLVDDAMGLGRDSDRLYDWKPKSFSLAEVVSSVCDLVRPIAEEKGVELRVSTIEPDRRLGQDIALYRVLVNLATNALKFTSEGHVEVSCRALSRSCVEWSVSDSGRGMDEATLASIDQFLDRRCMPKQRGLVSAGLGLAICRRFLDRMGSELRVETAPGRGTRFYFKLDLPSV